MHLAETQKSLNQLPPDINIDCSALSNNPIWSTEIFTGTSARTEIIEITQRETAMAANSHLNSVNLTLRGIFK